MNTAFGTRLIKLFMSYRKLEIQCTQLCNAKLLGMNQ